MIEFRHGLDTLPTYHAEEREWKIKLDANENNDNLPPRVLEKIEHAMRSAAFNRYPDPDARNLRSLIASDFGLQPENILVGNGSSELLEKFCYSFGGSGRRILIPSPSFSMYAIFSKMAESEPVLLPLNEDFSLDADILLEAAEVSTPGLIILCTPNNPSGNVTLIDAIERIAANVSCPVLIDEAYHEFSGGPSAVSLIPKYENVIVAKTFSKAYSLASARVGYIIAHPELLAGVRRSVRPYHINALSLLTAEIVYAMKDEFRPVIAQIISERERISKHLGQRKEIRVFPSDSNFILIKLLGAEKLVSFLESKSIAVRFFGSDAGLENCIRVSVGRPSENDAFLRSVDEYFGGNK